MLFSEIDKHIEADDLVKEFKMSALPSLYEHFVSLISYLVSSKTFCVKIFLVL